MKANYKTDHEWLKIFKEFETISLTFGDFCKHHGIGQSTFYQKKKQLDIDIDKKDIPTSRFQSIIIKSEEVSINLNGNIVKGNIEVIRSLLRVHS